jgi:hypothetical protein
VAGGGGRVEGSLIQVTSVSLSNGGGGRGEGGHNKGVGGLNLYFPSISR